MASKTAIVVRQAQLMDGDLVWAMIEPVIRAGETYALPRDMTRVDALSYWFSLEHEVFVAEDGEQILGTYYLKANHQGGGDHVANCGYVTAPWAAGRGVAQAMLTHSFESARKRGFRSMQFNFVVASNERAVRLWANNGFETVGTLPEAFKHPVLGYVDALIMFRKL